MGSIISRLTEIKLPNPKYAPILIVDRADIPHCRILSPGVYRTSSRTDPPTKRAKALVVISTTTNLVNPIYDVHIAPSSVHTQRTTLCVRRVHPFPDIPELYFRLRGKRDECCSAGCWTKPLKFNKLIGHHQLSNKSQFHRSQHAK